MRAMLLWALIVSPLTALACEGGSRAYQDWSHAFPDANMTPQLLGAGIISTGDDESHPTLAPTAPILYFLKNTPSFDFWTIVMSERCAHGWSRPRTAPFSGRYADADIAFTPDGKRAYFISKRPVDGKPRRDTEIWVIERQGESWLEPRHVAELSSPADEWFPTIAADGSLYFGSDRPGGLGLTDIWRAQRTEDGFEPPRNLGAPINTAGNEIEAFVTPDEQMMILSARDRGDALGAYDLYVAIREGQQWREPKHLDAPINSPAWEFAPRLSPDGKIFLFSSNRGFGSEAPSRALTFDELERRIRSPQNGLRDIYYLDATALRTGQSGE